MSATDSAQLNPESGHVSVLLGEAVQAMALKPDDLVVDGTFGRGGHSAALLDQLGDEGRLIAFDRDLAALDAARRFAGDARFEIVHASFDEMAERLAERVGDRQVDALLLDLGVSSPQLDEAERGFGFNREGPLDMRMDQSRGETAGDWLATAEHGEILRVLRDYGEERFARRIADAITAARALAPIETTLQLAELIAAAIPRKAHDPKKHPATRSFQAIRIRVNGELEALDRVLERIPDLLALGGRVVIISFHSLEDRRVKRAMRAWSQIPAHLRALPVPDAQLPKAPMRLIGGAIKPSSEECERNRRARSAVMRVAQKVADVHEVWS